MKPIPEVNKVYNYFDDGKIWESRKLSVKIISIIPFKEADNDLISDWEENVENCDWLYANKTDYFIKGELNVEEKNPIIIYFVRTINGDWFSLGWWAGILDIDNSLTMQ